MNLKKQLKKMKKQQKIYEQLIKAERATCPHITKKGKSRLEEFMEGNVRKARCTRCGEVVILDKDLLAKDSVQMSADIIKTTLAELRAQTHLGNIELDPSSMKMITEFDSEVLRDLPELMERMRQVSKGKKKKRKKKRKKNQRRRFY